MPFFYAVIGPPVCNITGMMCLFKNQQWFDATSCDCPNLCDRTIVTRMESIEVWRIFCLTNQVLFANDCRDIFMARLIPPWVSIWPFRRRESGVRCCSAFSISLVNCFHNKIHKQKILNNFQNCSGIRWICGAISWLQFSNRRRDDIFDHRTYFWSDFGVDWLVLQEEKHKKCSVPVNFLIMLQWIP